MAFPSAQQHSNLKILLWIAFIGLFALALVVVLFLPSQVVQKPNTQVNVLSQPKLIPNSNEALLKVKKADTAEKLAAEKLIKESLQLLSRLENAGARIWGKEKLKTSLSIAEESLKKANTHYDKQQYSQSLKYFRDSITAFKQLEGSRKERFKNAMDNGLKAYKELNSSGAIAQFKIAKALVPGSDKANNFFNRSKKLPKVLTYIKSGKEHEKSKNIEQASVSYQAAVSLDSAYLPAKKLLSKIQSKIANRNYQKSISDALTLLDKLDIKGAAQALRRAQNIHPNTPEIKDIAQRIKNASKISTLNKLRKTAINYEKQEQWLKALDQYRKALLIDNSAAFAHRGGLRAKYFLDLYKSIDVYLENPTRLYSNDPVKHAKQLYVHSGSLDGGGSVLKSKRKKLRELITSALTPVSVLLKSDQITFVEIYRRGNLGSFQTKRIKMLPGNYTAVGSRPGHRDVMVKFKVLPGAKELIITIKNTDQVK